MFMSNEYNRRTEQSIISGCKQVFRGLLWKFSANSKCDNVNKIKGFGDSLQL